MTADRLPMLLSSSKVNVIRKIGNFFVCLLNRNSDLCSIVATKFFAKLRNFPRMLSHVRKNDPADHLRCERGFQDLRSYVSPQ